MMKNLEIPQVSAINAPRSNPLFTKVSGWDEFYTWAVYQVPVWQKVVQMCDRDNINIPGAMKLIAYHLTVENQDLKDQLLNMHLNHPPKEIFILPPRLTFWQRVRAVFKP